MIVACDDTTNNHIAYWKSALLYSKIYQPEQIIMLSEDVKSVTLQEFEEYAQSNKGYGKFLPQCLIKSMIKHSVISFFSTGITNTNNIIECDQTFAFSYIEVYLFKAIDHVSSTPKITTHHPINFLTILPIIRKGRFRVFVDDIIVLSGSRGKMVLTCINPSLSSSILHSDPKLDQNPWHFIPQQMHSYNAWLNRKIKKKFKSIYCYTSRKFIRFYKRFNIFVLESINFIKYKIESASNDEIICFLEKSAHDSELYCKEFEKLCTKFELEITSNDEQIHPKYIAAKSMLLRNFQYITLHCQLVATYFNSNVLVREAVLI